MNYKITIGIPQKKIKKISNQITYTLRTFEYARNILEMLF